jgi:hypothetical protein
MNRFCVRLPLSINEAKVVTQRGWSDPLRAIVVVWILISPWVLLHAADPMRIEAAASWNALAIGISLILLSVSAITTSRIWEAVIGLWLIASPWLLQFSLNRVLTWNAVIAGLLLVALSVGAVREGRKSGTR